MHVLDPIRFLFGILKKKLVFVAIAQLGLGNSTQYYKKKLIFLHDVEKCELNLLFSLTSV